MFVEKFQELLKNSPRYNVKNVMSENSKYADTIVKSSSCYYSFCLFFCDKVFYWRYSRQCTDCSGISFCVECSFCVDCTDCIKCNGCILSRNCHNSYACIACTDCYSCDSCIGCTSLSKKRFHIFNEQYSEEEYNKKKEELDLDSEHTRGLLLKKANEAWKMVPRVAWHQTMTEDSLGENLSEASRAYHCYDAFKLENVAYWIECNAVKDSSDITVCLEVENCYSCVQSPMCSNSAFMLHSDNCSFSQFCAYSQSLQDCFWCTYLSHKQYHILNEPYSEQEYFEKVKEIKVELAEKSLYNMDVFMVGEYEKQRKLNEEDPVICI